MKTISCLNGLIAVALGGCLALAAAAQQPGNAPRTGTPIPYQRPATPPWASTPRPTASPTPTPTPTASPTPTPTPTPAATATPTSAGSGPSIPLALLNKDEALRTLRPPTIDFDLSRIRIIRSRRYDQAEPGKGTAPVGLAAFLDGDVFRQIVRPGMTFFFTLQTPDYCGIVDIKDVQVRSLTGEKGQPLPLLPEDTAPNSAAAKFSPENIIAWEGGQALVQMTTGLPPREDKALQKIEMAFNVQFGTREEYAIATVRDRIGQPLLTGPAAADLDLRVQSITADQIVVVGLGAVKRLGKVYFETTGGTAVTPFSDTLDVKAGDAQGTPLQTMTFSFIDLPQLLTMKVEYYPQVIQRNIVLSWENIPLP